MSFSARDIVPFTQARANLSDLAKAWRHRENHHQERESYVALIGRSAGLLPSPGRDIHLLLIDDARLCNRYTAGCTVDADEPSPDSAAPLAGAYRPSGKSAEAWLTRCRSS